jgi:hypothetical protein
MVIQKFAPQWLQPVDVGGREYVDQIAHGRERSLIKLPADDLEPATPVRGAGC